MLGTGDVTENTDPGLIKLSVYLGRQINNYNTLHRVKNRVEVKDLWQRPLVAEEASEKSLRNTVFKLRPEGQEHDKWVNFGRRVFRQTTLAEEV